MIFAVCNEHATNLYDVLLVFGVFAGIALVLWVIGSW